MNGLISLGSAKIASARSPIIPASTSAGAFFSGPSSLASVFKAEVAFPKLTRPAIGSCDRVGVFAIGDCLHALRRIKLLEVGDLPAPHHAPHASHHSSHRATFLLSCLWGTLLRFFQKCEQVGTRLGLVCTENLNPQIMMMKPTQDRV